MADQPVATGVKNACSNQPQMTRVWLALGSNLGDRDRYLESARAALSDAGVKLVRESRVSETEPVGITDQPRFLNQVLEVETSLEPRPLLETVKRIEEQVGRIQRQRWGPREIDIDILRYDGRTGAFIDVFASGGGLTKPSALTFGPDGNLYVNSQGTNAVLRYDGITGRFMDMFVTGDPSDPSDQINQDSTGLTFGPDGNLYINSHKTDSVLRFDGKTGAPRGVFAVGPELQQPAGLAFGPDGNLYVASHGPNPVLRYDGVTGALIDIFVAAGAGSIRNPTVLQFGRDGTLYVASRGNSRVLRFKSRKSSFALERGVDVDLNQYPVLSWTWKVSELPAGGDFRYLHTDDQAAQVDDIGRTGVEAVFRATDQP